MRDFFFLCHKRKFMFLSVSKVASTSLKTLLYEEEFGRPFEPRQGVDIHAYWGFRARKGRMIRREDRETWRGYADYLRFAVYRDPVDRLVSTYHSKVLYAPKPHPFYTRHRLEGLPLDPFLDVVDEVLRIDTPEHIDEHLRPQRRCYAPEDVDVIVPIEHLPEFLRRSFGIERVPSENVVTAPKFAPTSAQIERSKDLYREDYAIFPNYVP